MYFLWRTVPTYESLILVSFSSVFFILITVATSGAGTLLSQCTIVFWFNDSRGANNFNLFWPHIENKGNLTNSVVLYKKKKHGLCFFFLILRHNHICNNNLMPNDTTALSIAGLVYYRIQHWTNVQWVPVLIALNVSPVTL